MKLVGKHTVPRGCRGSTDGTSAVLIGAISLCLLLSAVFASGAFLGYQKERAAERASEEIVTVETVTAESIAAGTSVPRQTARPWESGGASTEYTETEPVKVTEPAKETVPGDHATSERPVSLAAETAPSRKTPARTESAGQSLIGTAYDSPVQTGRPDFSAARPVSEQIAALTGDVVQSSLSEAPKTALTEGSAKTVLSAASVKTGAWHTVKNCRITHYCSCAACCGKSDGITATGTRVKEGRTVAVDPKVIPLGSEVLINGHVYIAEDTGVSGNAVDVFIDSHARSLRMGVYRATVQWR